MGESGLRGVEGALGSELPPSPFTIIIRFFCFRPQREMFKEVQNFKVAYQDYSGFPKKRIRIRDQEIMLTLIRNNTASTVLNGSIPSPLTRM